MTAQISESITYKNEKYNLLSTPLCRFFSLTGTENPFRSGFTALWRGYLGEWEIIDDRLYLISVKAGFDEENTTALIDIFPGFEQRVFAHWYSGELRIPLGEQIEYVHMGFGSKYEQELFLDVQQGRVINETLKDNKKC